MTQEQEKDSSVIPFPIHSGETHYAVPEKIPFNPQSINAIQEIQQRTGHTEATTEDITAMAIDVFNTITKHLSQSDSRVILHTTGVGVKKLDIKSSAGSFKEGVRTVYKRTQSPKASQGVGAGERPPQEASAEKELESVTRLSL